MWREPVPLIVKVFNNYVTETIISNTNFKTLSTSQSHDGFTSTVVPELRTGSCTKQNSFDLTSK